MVRQRPSGAVCQIDKTQVSKSGHFAYSPPYNILIFFFIFKDRGTDWIVIG
jgi:hypothetical protein